MPSYNAYETYQKNRSHLESAIREVLAEMKGYSIPIGRKLHANGEPFGALDHDAVVQFITDMFAALDVASPFLIQGDARRFYGSYIYIALRRAEWLSRIDRELDKLKRARPVTFRDLIRTAETAEGVLSAGDGVSKCPGFEIRAILEDPAYAKFGIASDDDVTVNLPVNLGDPDDIRIQDPGRAPEQGKSLSETLSWLQKNMSHSMAAAEKRYRNDAQAAVNMYTANNFEFRDEYMSACREFARLLDVIEDKSGFADTIQAVADAYLAMSGLAPVCDADKALQVYSEIYDGPCKTAAHYAGNIHA